MEEEAIRGIRWTLLGYAANRVVTLVTTVVLARLLVPGDFGLIAFAAVVIGALSQIAGMGLAPALVVRQDIPTPLLGTGFTLLLALNAAGALAVVGAAPFAEAVIDDSRATGVVAALAAPVAIAGISHFYAAVLQRELLFRQLFASQVSQVVVFAAVAVSLAAADAGIWSLVGGQIAGALAYAATLALSSPQRVRPAFDRSEAASLLRSGRGFLLQGGLTFVEQNADYAVLGSTAGARQLGLYSMAYRVSELPYRGIVEPVAQTTFPGFARMRERAEDVTAGFLTALQVTCFCAFPLGLIASGASDPLVDALFGSKWAGMDDLVVILGLWGSLRVIQGTIGWFINSMGLSWEIARGYSVLLAISIPLLVILADTEGARGVAWVMVGNIAVMTVIVGRLAHLHADVSYARQWLAVRASVVGGAAAWATAAGLAATTDDVAPGLALGACVLGATSVYLLVIRVVAPTLVGETVRQLRLTMAG